VLYNTGHTQKVVERAENINIIIIIKMADEIDDSEVEEEVKDAELNTDDTPTDDNGEVQE
jgi:hypothetical protein